MARLNYPLTSKLKEAIEILYENTETGLMALGIGGFPTSAKEPLKNREISYIKRANLFRQKLENWVELYSLEFEEFDSDYDSLRLRSEARAILMALRELYTHLPEVFEE